MTNSADPNQTAQQSDLGPHCLILCLNKSIIICMICSRRLQPTTSSDAFLVDALQPRNLQVSNEIVHELEFEDICVQVAVE